MPFQPNDPPQPDDPPQIDEPLPSDDPAQFNGSCQTDESSEDNGLLEANQPSRVIASLQDKDPGDQFLHKCVLVPPKRPMTNTHPPRQRRRANPTEMLQKYPKRLEEKEKAAKRPSRQAKLDIDGLRTSGVGIYAQDGKSFPQNAFERMARASALADYVDNASPSTVAARQGRTSKKRLRLVGPSHNDDGDNDDSADSGNDDGDDNDDDDDDDEEEGDYVRPRHDPELHAKHMRLLMAHGFCPGQQQAHGPMYT